MKNKLDKRIKILELKVEKIIGKLNLDNSNLEMGYEWSDSFEEELKELEKTK